MVDTIHSSLSDVVLHLRTSQRDFDVASESDVIALLRTIHQNPLDDELKNQIRDHIFSYRQSPNDAYVQALKSLLEPLGVYVFASKVSETTVLHIGTTSPTHVHESQKKIATFGYTRQVPQFNVASTPKIAQEEEKFAVSNTPVPVTEPLVQTAVAVDTTVLPQQEAIKEIDTPPPVESPAPVTNEVVSIAKEASPVVQKENASLKLPAERIAEIKRIVNEKVGNPVNLIDAHNALGREYMNALLDAMKKSNGGQAQEVADAMTRLEKAYGAVVEVLGKEPLHATTPHETIPVQKDITGLAPVSVNPSLDTADTHVNPVQVRITQEKPLPTEYVALGSSTEANVSSQRTAPPLPAGGMHSVAKAKQLQELLTSNRQEQDKNKREVQALQNPDPLFAPEITAGLGQLLSEWSLFKSSGLFGTGPSGKDHTLYLKLAPLTMSAVIAGRFEGATPKIKQNIADYMNGWRYEEGIMHEHTETFEHYLRRVITHILSKRTFSK